MSVAVDGFEKAHFYWKCNFPMDPHVSLLIGWMISQFIISYEKFYIFTIQLEMTNLIKPFLDCVFLRGPFSSHKYYDMSYYGVAPHKKGNR